MPLRISTEISESGSPESEPGRVRKIRHSSHIDPILAKLSRMVLLCLKTLIEVEILKTAHRLGLGDQKRGKTGPKPHFF